MFRKMRRFKQGLTEQECIAVLKKEPRGVLAVHGEDGYPYALPMDYIYMDGKLYFHSALEGHKLDAISADNHVSFCVMDEGYKKQGEWALNIQSIVIFGRMRVVEEQEEIGRIARKLAEKYYPTPESIEKIMNSVSRIKVLELTIDHMTGKLVNES